MKIIDSFYLWLVYFSLFNIVLGYSVGDTLLKRVELLSDLQYDIASQKNTLLNKRNSLQSNPLVNESIGFDDHIRLALRAYNQTFYLHLLPNLDIFHPKAVINQRESTQLNPQDFKVYRGYVIDPETSQERWEKEKSGILQENLPNKEVMGWARIVITGSSRHGRPIIEGAFQVHNDQFHVKTAKNYNISKRSGDASVYAESEEHMVVYKDSEILNKRGSRESLCGFDKLRQTQNHAPFLAKNRRSGSGTFGNPLHSNKNSLFKRSSVTQGCPTTKKINYMGVAADCTYVKHYGSANRARMQIINNFNMVSALFEETFNVAIGLINITIMDTTCPSEIDDSQSWNRACDIEYPLNDRLSDFSRWRSQMPNDGAGLWHLMTNCPSGVEIGMAWLQQLCKTDSQIQISEEGKTQYVSGAGVSAITHNEWKIVAHEIGHGFGAIHDCTKDDCSCSGDDCNCCQLHQNQCTADGNFIMNPSSDSTAKNFSPCSVNAICSAFPSTATCLSDLSERKHDVFKLDTCGNGVLEEGEECDTGGKESACCDPKTCKLINNAVCEDSNGSCCHECQLLPKTHLCRPSASLCDIDEYCTATSPFCPSDNFIKDGTVCGSNGLKCASGQCTSRDAQCLTRGTSLNITRSCMTNNEECQILCNAPGDTEKCLMISGFFVNGTPCGFNGHCVDGTCQNGDAISSGVIWMEDHKIVTIHGCILVLFNIFVFLFLIVRIGCGFHWKRIWFRRKTGYRQLPDYTTLGAQDVMIASDNNSETSSMTENDLHYEDNHLYHWNSRVSFDSTMGEYCSHSSSNSTVVEDVNNHSDCNNKS